MDSSELVFQSLNFTEVVVFLIVTYSKNTAFIKTLKIMLLQCAEKAFQSPSDPMAKGKYVRQQELVLRISVANNVARVVNLLENI